MSEGQLVDWSPGGYEPNVSLWPPQGTFVRLQIIATQLNIPTIGALNIYTQSRLGAEECLAILAHWKAMENAVDGTPGAGPVKLR